MFPAKEAPASSHMLVSRAERGLQATIWSSGRTSKHFWCKKGLFSSSQCFRPRKLLPVVICLSHGLSEVFRPRSGARFLPFWRQGALPSICAKKACFSSSSCETACFLPRKLLPVVICLSHGLSEVFRPRSGAQGALPSIFGAKKACFLQVLAKQCFRPRKLLPVVICLSHGLSEVFRPRSGARFLPFWRQGTLPSICAKKACFSSSSCETACFLPSKLQ